MATASSDVIALVCLLDTHCSYTISIAEVCDCVCIHVCVYARVCVCTCVCMHVCVYARVCVHACVYIVCKMCSTMEIWIICFVVCVNLCSWKI